MNWQQLPKERKASEAFQIECNALAAIYSPAKEVARERQSLRHAPATIYEKAIIDKVNTIVANYYKVEPSLLRKVTKQSSTVVMRGIAMWFCHYRLSMRHFAIADYYNSKHHHKSLYMVQSIDDMRNNYFPDPRTGIFVKKDLEEIKPIIQDYIQTQITHLQ